MSEHGDRLFIVGGHSNHGRWDPDKTEVELFTDAENYPIWSGTWNVDRDSDSENEYKLVIKRANGKQVWEGIENRRLLVSPRGKQIVQLIFNDPVQLNTSMDHTEAG